MFETKVTSALLTRPGRRLTPMEWGRLYARLPD